jgi:hypothetical protein
MNMKGKIDLYAKIRHEYRWGVGTIRGLAEMFNVHRRLVRDALDNPLPPKRKIPLRQHTSLASAIPLIDVLLLADRDVPYSQKHSAPSIHHQIQCESAGLRVAGSTVRGYVRKRKIELGLGSQRVDLAAERTVVFEWMRFFLTSPLQKLRLLSRWNLEELESKLGGFRLEVFDL